MSQKGFTLVELALVLVIIGVILGGVIKGQELVTNARMKQLYRNFQQVEFAYFSYIDRYNDKPGDDARAVTGAAAGDPSDTSNNDGDEDNKIEGTWNASPTNTAEPARLWAHLRDAGFLSDGLTGNALPQHAFGGNIGVVTGGLEIADDVVCFEGIEGAIAGAFDSQFDDGVSNTGNIRGRSADTTTTAAAEAAYATDETATMICISLGN